MQIGSCWTKTEKREDGKAVVTGISVTLDEAVLELLPQLKGVNLVLKPIPQDQITKENSPHWRFQMYKPKKKTEEAPATPDVGDISF